MYDFNSQKQYNFRGFYIPTRMVGGLQHYIENHIKPGSFLSAVIKNDLIAACEQADDENMRNLPAYVAFLYNEAPRQCWGSEEAFKNWLKNKDH